MGGVDAGGLKMIKVYHPWPVPVQALCYSEPSVLTDMEVWVRRVRERGLIGSDVRFAVRREEVPVGVLSDEGGSREVRPSAYLVFARDGFEVVDRMSFHRRYREP